MRQNRLKPPEGGVFHIVSRVVDRAMKFNSQEKEIFTGMMRRAERFSGVEILAYCVMSNHFHILVRVPSEGTEIGEAELLDRHAALYGEARRRRLERSWERRREKGREESVEREKVALLARMHDVSEFAKTLKQRYSISYNRRHDRKGTLWEERFRSVLAEDAPSVLREVAAYIDLNPVRAEMVEAPSSYRWSGIGALSSGDPAPLRGYLSLLGGDRRALEEYMDMVALRAASRLPRLSKARGQALQKVHPYSMSQIRCFTYGTAFGREAFVKKTGTGIAYPAEVEGLCTARPLAGEDGPTRLRAPGRGRG
jgi:REP element-mobilizing transposase RayT